MNCVMCGGKTTKVTEQRSSKYRDETVGVSSEFYRCDSCKEEFLTPDQSRNYVRSVKNEIRKKHGLLSPEHITRIRTKLELSQEALEELLGTGPKVVVRWESGKVIQGNGHDNMLRLLDREPGTIERLRQIQKLKGREQEAYAKSHKAASSASASAGQD